MVEILLPSSHTKWEGTVARSSDFELRVDNAIDALKTFKYSPPASLLDFLIHEKGLSALTHYVDNKYQLWLEGEDYLAQRGTVAAIETGLAWLGKSSAVEEASPLRRFWNMFQLALNDLETDPAALEKVEGIVRHATPTRSMFWRGFHGFDVRPLTFGEGNYGDHHYGEYSGVRISENGALWSFGRQYEFALAPTEVELTALGVWIAPAGDVQSLGWGDFSWADANASWADDGEEVRARLITNALKPRMSHIEFRDDADQVIGYRRLKSCQFVEFDANGPVEIDGIKYKYSVDPTRRILFEAMTDFGDGLGSTVATARIVFDGQAKAGIALGKRFLLPAEIENQTSPFAHQPVAIEFAQTVREKVRFLLTI